MVSLRYLLFFGRVSDDKSDKGLAGRMYPGHVERERS
jgi:hypothetical protein